MKDSVVFVGKRGDFYCERAKEFLESRFPNCRAVLGKRGEPFPRDVAAGEPAYLISYLSPWIIPAQVLANVGRAAINFHPGPPQYPGIGCTNFAIYNEESVFGVTCHHMAPKVDTGPIIAVRRFRLFEDDSVFDLTQRCYAHILVLFYDIVALLADGSDLPDAGETWTREAYRRVELEELCRIVPEMTRDEVLRRIRATTFPGAPGATVEIGGVRFVQQDDVPADSGREQCP